MYLTLILFIFPIPVQAYSFCPKCIHSSGTTNTCNLFKQHPLFKDYPEVNFIGKEICGEKGKYFSGGDKEKMDDDGTKETLFQEKIMRMVRD